ncbi:MAG: hypothetical protein ABIQ44_14965 [Chloroflexia bacterium]
MKRWRSVLAGCFALLLLSLAFNTGSVFALASSNDWQVGNTVYLSRGTQIRQGPGVDFCYHTIVPQNDWAVKVTGGPTFADGRTWYDTSRAAAGDTSGGTGWVNVEQVDISPVPDDGGTLCAGAGTQAVTTPTPTAGEKAGIQIETPGFLLDLKSWWVSQSMVLKIVIVGVAVVLIVGLGRVANKDAANATVFGVIRAALAGVILGGVADLTRTYWQEQWLKFAGSAGGLDPALILLVAPVAWVVVSFVLNTVGRVFGLILGAIQILFLLMYIAPDRFNGLLDGIIGMFTGGK